MLKPLFCDLKSEHPFNLNIKKHRRLYGNLRLLEWYQCRTTRFLLDNTCNGDICCLFYLYFILYCRQSTSDFVTELHTHKTIYLFLMNICGFVLQLEIVNQLLLDFSMRFDLKDKYKSFYGHLSLIYLNFNWHIMYVYITVRRWFISGAAKTEKSKTLHWERQYMFVA
jgi:hypothetical protein